MRVPLKNMAGEVIGETELNDEVFAATVNEPLMHQALMRQLANARLGTQDTKTRGEVSGGGRKPWRQKGTGRARQGSTRAPHWRKGGIAGGPHPRSYEQKMPRRMRRLALRSALTVKAAQERVVVLDALEMPEPRTREMAAMLERLGVPTSALVLLAERNVIVERSAANLPDVKTLRASYINVRDLLGYDYLVLPQTSLTAIESMLRVE
jgi:large subunit ribosomal protein L4